jgi:hypothetical protein
MIAILPLLLAATSVGGDSVAVKRFVTQVASASVRIIQAERITPEAVEAKGKKTDRQIRQREAKPLVEFF